MGLFVTSIFSQICNGVMTFDWWQNSVSAQFLQTSNRVMALDWCQNFVSGQYPEKKLMEFDQILHMHL